MSFLSELARKQEELIQILEQLWWQRNERLSGKITRSISSALDTMGSSDDIGAVGGKLIFPDGTLQEARLPFKVYEAAAHGVPSLPLRCLPDNLAGPQAPI